MNTRDLDIHVGLEALLDPPGVGGDPLQVLQLLIVRPHHHALFSATVKSCLLRFAVANLDLL